MSLLELDLRSLRRAEDPYPLYRVLRDEAPVYFDEASGFYALTRFADVQAALSDHVRFSNVPPDVADGRKGRLSPLREQDPPRHAFLRKLVMPLFTPAAMRRMEQYLVDLARTLVDATERHDVVEASSQLAIPLPGRVTMDLLGVPAEAHARFRALTEERLHLLALQTGRAVPGSADRSIDEVRSDLWGIVGPVAAERRRNPEGDAITVLVQAQDRHGVGEISNDVIVDMLLHLLTGGFETTQHLIELLIDLLADRPELWARLRSDRSLVDVAIEEMLRWESPVQALGRRTTQEIVLHRTRIPSGSWVLTVYGAANRDEREFDDPDGYRLDRGVRRHLAFSFGIHYCPGAPVSRFEVRILLNELLDRYAAVERAGESERIPGQEFRGWNRVPVRFIRST